MKRRPGDLSVLKSTLLTLGFNILLAVAAVASMVFVSQLISGGSFSFTPATPTPSVIGLPPISGIAGQNRAASIIELMENQSNILATRRVYHGTHALEKLNLPSTSARPLNMGEKHTFWVTNREEDRQVQVGAHLAYAGEHVYFWVEDELEYQWDDVYALAHTFDQKIYPADRKILGLEYPPGIDRDAHIHILYTTHLASTTAGYFSSADAQPTRLHHLSNPRDMIFLNAKEVHLSSEYAYGVLAHEFAHMIQWANDNDEETWLTEGFAELAAFINGYRLGTFDAEFAKDTDIPLAVWPGKDGNATPHYGASFLFIDYLRGRFGDQALRDLAANPQNGMEGVGEMLEKIQARDPLTNQPITSDGLFLDWAITNYVNRSGISKGIYAYPNDLDLPKIEPSDIIGTCPSPTLTRSVNQYGADYVVIHCRGRYELEFQGTTQTALFPVPAHSGGYVFWSGKGDGLETTLTRAFDFTNARSPLTLIFWTWFDVEPDNDAVYLLISNDGGQTWQTLAPHAGQRLQSTADGFDRGYTGRSSRGRWVEEKFDLTAYAGQKVTVQFRYLSDEVYSGTGFILDDLSIPEIGYAVDFEDGEGGWQAYGFIRVINALPQNFRLALIRPGVLPGIVRLPLEQDNSLKIPLVVNDTAMLVITATNPLTSLPAAYRMRIAPVE